MKHLPRLTFACVLLLAAGTAQARVFETAEQCSARYGKPVCTLKTEVGSNVSYAKNGVSITVEFRKDSAVSATFFKLTDKDKPDENRVWSKEEIQKLLEASGGERKWGPVRKDMHGQPYWKTTDDALTARVMNDLYLKIDDNAEFGRRAKDIKPAAKPAPRDFEGF
jgi:hypothetical protein